MFTEENYIMWLSSIDMISIKKKYELMEHFGSAENVWKSSKKELIEFNNITYNAIEKIISSKNNNFLDKEIYNLYNKNIDYITIYDYRYPDLLKQIPDPPLGLYVIGELPNDNLRKVNVIGSRKCSEYGATNAYKFSKVFAENDIIVVSGMASGIDTMAHKGTLDGNGKTIAVLGCGVDICYPIINKELMQRIISNGCVISEYPLGTKPVSRNFPFRNRIISGLCDVTIVIEASKKSGTLITVNYALNQGRDIFAMPGNITSKLSSGVNEMIRDGAYVLTEPEDLLCFLGMTQKRENIEYDKKIIDTLEPEEKIVYAYISFEPISVDELVNKVNSNIQTIQYILTVLELKGHIQKLAGQRYIRSL